MRPAIDLDDFDVMSTRNNPTHVDSTRPKPVKHFRNIL